MIGGLNRRLLLAVAALAAAGTASAADDDTVRLGRFAPADKADVATGTAATLAGKDDDTELIHWHRRGFFGGGFYGGSFYGGGFVGPSFGFSYYRPSFGFGYYRPSFVSYSSYYAPPVFYSTPAYYVAPSYYYGGYCPIGGSDAPTVPLRQSAQPGRSFVPPAEVPPPMPPAGSFKYDGDPKAVPLPAPRPMTVPDAPQPGGPQRPETEGVRVSLPVKAEPSKFKYTAYGEKK